MQGPKKLRMLSPVRCDETMEALVKRAADREGRSTADLQRRAITFYLLQCHGDMVHLQEDEGDARGPRG